MKPIIPFTVQTQTSELILQLQLALYALRNDIQTPFMKQELVQSIAGTSTFQALEKFAQQNRIAGPKPDEVATDDIIKYLNSKLQEKNLLTPPNNDLWWVKGKIKKADGGTADRLIVMVYDRDLRNDEWIGKAISNASGQFEINYLRQQTISYERKTPDIFVRIFDLQANEIYKSPTYFNAQQTLDVTITLPATYRGASEFSKLDNTIIPILKETQLAPVDLDESTRQDYSFLAAETGLERQLIEFWSIAYRHQQGEFLKQLNVQALASWFYAWQRVPGFTQSKEAILLQSSDTLLQQLQTAVTKNYINDPGINFREALKSALPTEQRRITFERKRNGQPSYKELLSIVTSDTKIQDNLFSAIWATKEPINADFWKTLTTKPEFANQKEVLKKATILFDVTPLVDNQTAVGDYLVNKTSYNDLSDLAGYSTEQWESLLGTISATQNALKVPDYITGSNEKERIKNYVIQIENRMRSRFPMTYFQQDLRKDTKSETAFGKIRKDWQTFFVNNPTFEFGKQPVAMLLQTDKPSFKFDGINNPQTFSNELINTNRLFAIAPDYGHVSTLRQKGFTSAIDIAEYDYQGFEALVRDEIPVEAAQQYYSLATQKANLISTTFASIVSYCSIPTTVFGPSGMVVPTINAIVLPDNPAATKEVNQAVSAKLANLFGSLEQAECEECMSVLSPAAYFVDTLNRFSLDAPGTYNELIRRRADLGFIDLTCANTNTPLPYIDLVIEILERFIERNGSLPKQRKLTAQTTAPAEILEVVPETPTINEVYTYHLSVANYPASMPFNVHWEQLRLYLTHLGIRREEVMKYWLPADNEEKQKGKSAAIAAEYFGISPQEAAIITNTSIRDEDLHGYYGFKDKNVVKDALTNIEPPPDFEGKLSWDIALTGYVNVFLAKTGISYRDLLTLLSTRFVIGRKPATKPEIVSKLNMAPATAKLDELEIRNLTITHLHRIHRLIRLWRRLGWRIYDLDRMLMAVVADDIDQDTLTKLHRAEKIRQRLTLSFEECSVLCDSIDTYEEYRDFFGDGQPLIPSLLQKTFRNKSFGPAATLADEVMSEDHAYVAGICQLSVEDVEKLKKAFNLTKGTRKLHQLYGFGLLVHSTKISVDDFVILKELINIDFLQLDTTEKLLEAVNLVQQSKLSIADVKFILSVDSSPTVQASQLFEVLKKEIQTQRQAIAGLSVPGQETIGTLTKRLSTPHISTLLQEDESLIAELPYFDYSDLATKILSISEEPSMIGAQIHRLLEVSLSEAQRAILLLKAINADSTLTKLVVTKLPLFDNFPTTNDSTDRKTNLWEAFVDWSKFVAIHSAYKSKSDEQKAFEDRIRAATKPSLLGEEYKTVRKADICKRMGIKPDAEADKLLAELATLTDVKKINEQVRSYTKAKYGETEWLKMAKPLQDTLREKQRDALTDYVLTTFSQSHKFIDRNELYEYLLIDVEMSACTKTSRLKLAISSVQLFIERVLMGLERSGFSKMGDVLQIPTSSPLAKQWNKWRKWYRIWEANRKVFLYPENWIEPELRDNKSPFFEEFENQLAQNAVTAENAERAFRDYFTKFETVARLEIIAQYQEQGNPDGEGTLHVFGRTYFETRQYFYRRLIQKEWTAWESIDLDIEGDAMTPVVWNGKLYLFWLNFLKKSEKANSKMTIGTEEGVQTISSANPVNYYEIRLVWSEYSNGRWKTKKLSKDFINSSKLLSLGVREFDNFDTSDFARAFFTKEAFALYYENIIENNEAITLRLSANYFSFLMSEVPYNIKPSVLIRIHPNGAVNTSTEAIEENKSPFIEYLYFGNFTINTTPSLSIIEKKNNQTFADFSFPQPYSFCYEATFPTLQKPKNIFFQDGKNTFFLEEVNYNMPTYILGSLNYIHIQRRNSHLFYHPYASIFRLNLKSLINFFTISNQKENTGEKLLSNYTERKGLIFPEGDNKFAEMDFSYSGTYSLYNWELFFHIPITIACRLSENQQFAEARDWFHHIFDPSTGEAGGKERFWKFRPFYEKAKETNISLEALLKQGDEQVNKWADNPFQPHIIARMRIEAYMKFTVMRYIDNLTSWGDQLFSRDTIESINEATLLYVLAAKILGRRQQVVPRRAIPDTQRFESEIVIEPRPFSRTARITGNRSSSSLMHVLEDSVGMPYRGIGVNVYEQAGIKKQLDVFSNARVPINKFIAPNASASTNGLGDMDYFCMPKNPKLLGYWDTVADRLFKIRNCMNIQGMVRQLPLFEPPIDPALLVRAASMGLSIDAIINEVSSANESYYRFQVMLQKALELANEVKSLGAQLLSAFEKRDSEELALLRSTQERKLLKAVWDIKEQQLKESGNNVVSIFIQKESVELRVAYYNTLLKENESGISTKESIQLLNMSDQKTLSSEIIMSEVMANMMALIPDVKIGAATSLGATYGGSNLSAAIRAVGSAKSQQSQIKGLEASSTGILASYERRNKEWQLQLATANKELSQIEKQLLSAQIRHEIAQKELKNHELQMAHTEEIDQFMRAKFSNQQLYYRMKNQLSTLYMQSYRMAYDMAKKAEASFKKELFGNHSQSFINYANWGNLNEALLAGEKLTFDLRRMDVAYMEANKRSFELTKHISFAVHFPLELLTLRATGKCEINLKQSLFDWDYPKHKNRRVKSVSISIPCITGPYTTVGATLSHGNESIATSNGQNDSGVFELNFRDERYLPFEGLKLNAESVWKLEMSQPEQENRQFDYGTISDVILHIRYMADKKSIESDEDSVDQDNEISTERPTFGRLFSLRHEFPSLWKEWRKSGDQSSFKVTIPLDRLTYHLQKTKDNLLAIGIQMAPLLVKQTLSLTRPDDSEVINVTGFDSLDLDQDVYIIIQSNQPSV